MSLHGAQTKIHVIENWSFANATARVAAGAYTANDLGKISYQQDNQTYWRLTATTPTWVPLGSNSTDPSRTENGYLITALTGAGTTLTNKDTTGLPFGYVIMLTLADSNSWWTLQNGAPVAATGDVAVAGNGTIRWRKTSGL